MSVGRRRRQVEFIRHVTKTTKKPARHPRPENHPPGPPRAYAISLIRRWLVEKGFGWLGKQTGPNPAQWTLRDCKVDLAVSSSVCARTTLSQAAQADRTKTAAKFGESLRLEHLPRA